MRYIIRKSDDHFMTAHSVHEAVSLEDAKQWILDNSDKYTKFDYFVLYGKGLKKLAKFSFGFNGKWIAD